jgi:hypothetical protein
VLEWRLWVYRRVERVELLDQARTRHYVSLDFQLPDPEALSFLEAASLAVSGSPVPGWLPWPAWLPWRVAWWALAGLSPSLGGVLASYDASRAEISRLAHEVAKRLLR